MKIFWFMIFHAKLWLVQNHFVLVLIKTMGLLKFIMEVDVLFYLVLKSMMSFTIGLDIS